MDEQLEDTIDSLAEILDQERKSLLNGNLDSINRVSQKKEALIRILNTSELLNQERLVELNGKMKRNQALLSSALDGVKSVAERFADMRQIRESLATYDSNGRRKKITVLQKSSVEKRA